MFSPAYRLPAHRLPAHRLPAHRLTVRHLRRQIDKAFRDNGLEPPLDCVETVSVPTTRRLLQLTDYLAVWPVQLARLEIEDGRIAALQEPLPTTRRPVGLSTRADDLMSPATARLVGCLRDVAAGLKASVAASG